MQKRFLSAEAPDLIEVKHMDIHKYHACRHKEHQFDQGMVDHMEKGSHCRHGILFSQKPLHADAYRYKTDLGHGGTCQSPF